MRLLLQPQVSEVYANLGWTGMMPMFLTWARCISWTILLSALMAVLFALVLDGCSKL